VAVPVVVLTVVATLLDLRSRTIPNLLTGPALLLGLAAHLLAGGPVAGWHALLGCLLAGGLLLPGWMMGWMGAGDVKLMAAIGAWMGTVEGSLFAVLFSLIAGGFVAIAVAARKGILLRTMKNAALLLPKAAAGVATSGPPPSTSGVYVPKAIAFLAGSLFALWRPF
jgi:prepilin peptidase CpaA